MFEITSSNRGQILAGIILVVVGLALITSGAYYYFQRQIPKTAETVEEASREMIAIEKTSTLPAEDPQAEVSLEGEPAQILKMKEPSCRNECSQTALRRCSGSGYQVCGNNDEDSCLEWGLLTSCPLDTVCQDGSCIQRACSDGTLYGQCSSNKPKYCEEGTLTEQSSLCGCPSGYEVYRNQCREKLAESCGIIHEGSKDYSKAINFVIVPADSFFGNLRDNPRYQYSGNLDAFITDAQKNVADFLSIDPISRYQNIFNFYYSSTTVACAVDDDSSSVTCNAWEEAASKCAIPYDKVIVLKRKDGGGLCCNPLQSSAFTTTTFVHEIGHVVGFIDYERISSYAGPNRCTRESLDECGGAVCQFDTRWDYKPVELGGPVCALYVATKWDGTEYYVPNEQSAMNAGIDYKALTFTHIETAYLERLFAKIVFSGKDSVRCGSDAYATFTLAEYCHAL